MKSECLKISRILHAGYVFESAGTRIAFDPIFENPFSRNCFAFPSVGFDQNQIKAQKFDAVFISHFHDDHCSLDSLNLLDRRTPIYIFCLFEELFDWIKSLGFLKVHSLKLDVPVKIGTFEIIPRRALDKDVDSIFHIRMDRFNILNVVDSWIDFQTLDLLAKTEWDIILWPFQTMRELEVLSPRRALPPPAEIPPEWIEQLKVLNPKCIVPSSCQFRLESWSWYNRAFFPISYQNFQQQIQTALPMTGVIKLNPGVSIALKETGLVEPDQPLPWVVPLGDQDVDYEYRPSPPPATSEIARNFPALSQEQSAEVYRYCEAGLLEKYASLDSPEGAYFTEVRGWRLSLFDHEGSERQFHYEVKGNQIKLSNAMAGSISWLTEVPLAKLYAALELGESLTSMYIRINDQDFDPRIEEEMQFADVIEDPLIRCLFHGEFGSYQKAQLKRLCPR